MTSRRSESGTSHRNIPIDAVALDGPAGSGKSSVAKLCADALSFLYVDTGAMYRAVAWKAARQGINLADPLAMAEVAKEADLRFADGGTRILVDGYDASKEIRSRETSSQVKYAARVPEVRDILVAKQRKMAAAQPVVMEGRDITTVVLPNAKWKFFLTASPEARAKRRHAELTAAGKKVEFNQLLADISARDASDYQVGPLKDARDRALAGDGIIYLDTSELTRDQVVQAVLDRVREG
ncbi:MAG: (d)CMP kinase [Planctomycetes bacterium]|nr:(d)CMP kinase [Planctomycetota bacterium]